MWVCVPYCERVLDTKSSQNPQFRLKNSIALSSAFFLRIFNFRTSFIMQRTQNSVCILKRKSYKEFQLFRKQENCYGCILTICIKNFDVHTPLCSTIFSMCNSFHIPKINVAWQKENALLNFLPERFFTLLSFLWTQSPSL